MYVFLLSSVAWRRIGRRGSTGPCWKHALASPHLIAEHRFLWKGWPGSVGLVVKSCSSDTRSLSPDVPPFTPVFSVFLHPGQSLSPVLLDKLLSRDTGSTASHSAGLPLVHKGTILPILVSIAPLLPRYSTLPELRLRIRSGL